MSLAITEGQPAAPAPEPTADEQLELFIKDAEAQADQREGKPVSEPVAKPDWVEDKFWDAEKGEVNAEALAKSYRELQSKQSQKPAAAEDEAAPKVDDKSNPVSAAMAAAGLDFSTINSEYQSKGELPAETMTKLVDAFGQDMVDAYFNNLKTAEANLVSGYETNVMAPAGGADGYAAMSAWAVENVAAPDLVAYNKAVTSGDVGTAKLAVEAMFSRFSAQGGGRTPQLVNGAKTGNATNAQAYPSAEAMGADLMSPQYRSDPGFRAAVDARVDASLHLMNA
jgi:hypothetical protein